LPAEEDWEKVLDELAGCLGEEPVQNYDFKLKIGGFYEARGKIYVDVNVF
jgi:hypothetical protein